MCWMTWRAISARPYPAAAAAAAVPAPAPAPALFALRSLEQRQCGNQARRLLQPKARGKSRNALAASSTCPPYTVSLLGLFPRCPPCQTLTLFGLFRRCLPKVPDLQLVFSVV